MEKEAEYKYTLFQPTFGNRPEQYIGRDYLTNWYN